MTPKQRRLGDALYRIKDPGWFSCSANRLRRNMARAIKRAMRRDRKREGQALIQEQITPP